MGRTTLRDPLAALIAARALLADASVFNWYNVRRDDVQAAARAKVTTYLDAQRGMDAPAPEQLSTARASRN